MEVGIIFPYYFSIYLKRQIFKLKQHELNAKEAMEQAILAEGKYKSQLLRSEAMARVVHLIEVEDEFALVCENAVQEVCKTLQIQGGCILKTNADGLSIETILMENHICYLQIL